MLFEGSKYGTGRCKGKRCGRAAFYRKNNSHFDISILETYYITKIVERKGEMKQELPHIEKLIQIYFSFQRIYGTIDGISVSLFGKW